MLIALIGANIIVSNRGFNDPQFKYKYLFDVRGILQYREFHRLITSGFLHGDWRHLIFNMFSLFMFAILPAYELLLLYMLSLLFSNLFSLYLNRHQSGYKALGASGAVSAVIYSAIILRPEMSLNFILIPGLPIPGWLFGILYLVYSMYGMQSKQDNIGHEAHLGGAISGILISIVMYPDVLHTSLLLIVTLLLLFTVFILLSIFRPDLIEFDRFFKNRRY